MSRVLFCFLLVVAVTPVFAAPVYHPNGSNLTLGSGSNMQLISSYSNNPAAPAMVLEWEDWKFGMGILSSVGVGYEVGQVDNLSKEMDSLSKELENQDNLSRDDATALKNKFDEFLVKSGQDGYVRLDVAVQGPFSPFVLATHDFLGGALVLDANISGLAGVSILDSPLKYNDLAPGDQKLQTNTALYIKAAQVGEASIGYSAPVALYNNSTFSLGVKAKYYMVGLRKTLIGVAQADNMDSIVKDEQEKSFDYVDGFGFDIGALWQSINYRFGATVRNVNSPSFDYLPIGQNCSSLSGTEQNSCFIANSYSDRITLSETWVMEPQGNIEFSYFSDDLTWVGGVTLDTNGVNDPLGAQYQWITLSGAYATNHWVLPGFRVGYRKNLIGTKLSYATLGFTFFKIVNFDLAWGLQNIEIDGRRYPRSSYANLGLEILF